MVEVLKIQLSVAAFRIVPRGLLSRQKKSKETRKDLIADSLAIGSGPRETLRLNT
jgi:hypothetical protein